MPNRDRWAMGRRTDHTVLALLLFTAGCTGIESFMKPEGDGGWSAARRQYEVSRRAAAAGVDLGSASPTPAAETPAPTPPQVAGPVDLRSALDLAAANNRRIAEARADVAAAGERVAEVRGRLLPASTGTGRYTWYSDEQVANVTFPSNLLPPGAKSPVIPVRDKDFGTVGGVVSLPIDITGELRQALAAAQAGYRGEKARLWATTLEQQVRAVRAYFALLETQRLKEVTEQTIGVDRQQVAIAESRYQNGRVTKNDLLVVQVALQNEEQNLVQRLLEIAVARWELNQALGLDVNAPTVVVDVTQRPELPEIAEALQLTYTHNPVLAALLEEQQRLAANLESLQRSRLPRFSAGGAIDYSSSNIIAPQRTESGFTGFTWDLGTDLRRQAAIAEARIGLDRNRLAVERQMREIESAVRTTRQATEERLSALAAAESAVGQAEENLRIRQQQFEVGRAQSDDVLIAVMLLAQQRAILATSLYQAHSRRAELQQLMGLPLDMELPGASR